MHREVHNAGDVWAISVSVFNCSPAVAHTHATTYRWMWHAGTPLVSDKDAAVHTFFPLLSVDHSVTAICLVNTGQDEWGRGVEWGGEGSGSSRSGCLFAGEKISLLAVHHKLACTSLTDVTSCSHRRLHIITMRIIMLFH